MNMKVIVLGNGISGLTAAIKLAESGIQVTLVAPFAPERSQSVMAAGGINAVLAHGLEGDTIEAHVLDTLKGGVFIENSDDVKNLCEKAPDHLRFLESIGVVFSRDDLGNVKRRAFGGQSYKRTAYAGTSTGKQIMTALIQKCREYEIKGLIHTITGLVFQSALIRNGRCYGVILMDRMTGELQVLYADATIMATGGQNKLFGKTTGTEICDGYAAGKLFTQGVTLRNLEFIQYHPTAIVTAHKKMLISEAARGEGGRLFYMKGKERCYFMEEQFGEKGNLMPRDIVSRCVYHCPSQVYLDVTFLGKKVILEKLREIYDLCLEYINLDITKECIPITPSVHYFMGGIAVNSEHETNIKGLYAVGECASKYHGANRLGGNSLLSAVHSGTVAAQACSRLHFHEQEVPDFSDEIRQNKEQITAMKASKSKFPSTYILNEVAAIMNDNLGIVRCEKELLSGIENMDFYINAMSKISYDPDVSIYENYRVLYMALLAKAILSSALYRKESRGSHFRSDYPETVDDFKKNSYASYYNGDIKIEFCEGEQR